MAQTSIVFRTAKVERFFKQLKKNKDQITDRHKAYWASISIIGFKDVIEHFEKEQGPKGRWKKWSKLYKEHMDKIGKGTNKKLQDTGRLRQSTVIPMRSGEIRKGYLVFNPAQTSKGFPYAYAHDRGGPKLPKREFMWLSLKAMNRISIITANYMLKDT